MANDCSNYLIVVGLEDQPAEFAKTLELAMYGCVVPDGEYYSVRVVKGRHMEFHFKTKWQPKLEALTALSEKRKGIPFLLEYSCWESGFRGQAVIQNGKVVEHTNRVGYDGPAYLFADLTHPLVDLFSRYLEPRTLALQAAGRLQDAIRIVEGLKKTLEDDRFAGSRYRDYGDDEQLDRTLAGLTAMLDTMVADAAGISFEGVLLEEPSVTDRNARAKVAKVNERMKGLGLDCLVPDRDKAARFAILPFRAATVGNPLRIIVPVLHYTNADPDTGKYRMVADGSAPPIEWEIRYVELSRFELEGVKNLPDEGQTEYDIDIVLTRPNHTFNHELNRISSKARWKQTPELAEHVEKAAAEASDAFAAKLVGVAGVTIFDNFQSADPEHWEAMGTGLVPQ
ncbi:MAG: hypothetical protein ACHP8B_10765 [Terriglobales bacterium]